MNTEKMVSIEFYLLAEDNTWDTDFIAIPESLYEDYVKTNNPSPIVDWVYANAKFKENICMVGIYNDEPVEWED